MKTDDGLLSTAGYIVVGILFALSLNFGLGIILDTDLPIVAVQSCSMIHQMDVVSKFFVVLEQEATKNIARCQNMDAVIPDDAFRASPLSGGFDMGDLLILSGYDKAGLKGGDVIVFTPSVPCGQGQANVPIVHRIISINSDGSFQTQGDANRGQLACEKNIQPGQVHGKAIFIVPYLGWIKIFAAEVVWPNILSSLAIAAAIYILWKATNLGEKLKHI